MVRVKRRLAGGAHALTVYMSLNFLAEATGWKSAGACRCVMLPERMRVFA